MMLSTLNTRVIFAATLAFFAALPAQAQEGPPLQTSVVLPMPAADGAAAATSSGIEGGGAKVRVSAVNRGDVVQVDLRFRYRIPEDTIAFDEILSRIEIETADDGEVYSRSTIVPNEMNLNPNRASLRYRVTLYRPEGGYAVRMRLFGNYE
jgi:hypothetical protein